MFEGVLEKISSGTFIREGVLSLANYGLEKQQIKDLVEALLKKKDVKKVDLSFNEINDDDVDELVKLIELNEIDLTGNDIGPNGALKLSKSNIKKINLSANPIGSPGASYFSDTPATHLYLNECNIKEDGINALLQNSRLVSLSLSSNNISPDAVLEFPKGNALEELDLSQNLLTDKSMSEIKNLENLTYIDLTSNSLTNKTALAVSTLKKLETVILSQNRHITGDAIQYALRSKSITSFQLANNGLSSFSSDNIPENNSNDIPENNSIVKINLSSNNLDDRCATVLAQLAQIHSLKNFSLVDNKLGSDGISALIQCRPDALNILDLRFNPGIEKQSPRNDSPKRRRLSDE